MSEGKKRKLLTWREMKAGVRRAQPRVLRGSTLSGSCRYPESGPNPPETLACAHCRSSLRDKHSRSLHLHFPEQTFAAGGARGSDSDPPLTFGVDNLVDLMRVVGILGIVLDHLEAHRQVVEGAAEVGFPSGLVGGELVDLPAGDGPGLKRHTNH